MIDQVTIWYILKLLFFVGMLLVLFGTYGRLTRRHMPLLQDTTGGFISFLAVSELLALPFILVHLSFDAFYLLFMLINAPLLLYGLWLLIKKLSPHKLWPISPFLFLAVLSMAACMLLTQFYVKYDADDSFYVSLVRQNLESDDLYSTDPATADPRLAFPGVYRLEGWDLVESSLAKTFGLSALEFTHGLVPLMAIPLVFLLFRRIFFYLTRDHRLADLCLALLGVMFIFSGYSLYSQGTFLMTRSWQGKAILASLVIPILLYAISLIKDRPADKKIYRSILVISIASLALNPAAIYLVAAAGIAGGLVLLVATRTLGPVVKLGVAFVPILIAGLIMLLARPGEGGTETVPATSYFEYLRRFMGGSWYFPASLVGLTIFYRNKIMLRGRTLLYWLPAALLATAVNPLVFPVLKNYVASNTYWRLFWLIPLYIIFPVLGAVIFLKLSSRVKEVRPVIKTMLLSLSVLMLSVLTAAAGSFMFDTSRPLVAKDVTVQKVPPGVAGVADYLSTAPMGTVLASTDPAAYLHNFTDSHPLVVSRWLYISVNSRPGSQQYYELNELFDTVNGTGNSVSNEKFRSLLDKYSVDYVVAPKTNSFVSGFAEFFGLPTLYTNELYVVIKTS